MIKHSLSVLLAASAASLSVLADTPRDKPLTESELLKQIETLNPLKGGATPSPVPTTPGENALLKSAKPAVDSLKGTPPDRLGIPGTSGTMIGSGASSGTMIGNGTVGDKKTKAPTEITALEATFDQKNNVAVFIGSVIVKDPEFNCVCDKLTAYLKHDDKPATPTAGLGKATPKPVTPKPATPNPDGTVPPAKKSGGLDHAIAVTTSERRVIITQDKVEADGSITHGIGISDRAEYDANTGNIKLFGMPDVTQGPNRCIATDATTTMTLNRDGHMTAVGPHKTIITDTGDRDAPPKADAAPRTPAPK